MHRIPIVVCSAHRPNIWEMFAEPEVFLTLVDWCTKNAREFSPWRSGIYGGLEPDA